MSINVSRRNITAGISSSLVAPVLMLTASESSAFLPFLLRFIFQGVVRSTATRTVATTATRTLSSGAIRTVTTQFKSVVNLGITTTGIAAVSSGVYALADKHRAEQIWVSGTEYLNKFVLTTEKAISEPDTHKKVYQVLK